MGWRWTRATGCWNPKVLPDTIAAICNKAAILKFSRTPEPLLPSTLPVNGPFIRNNGPGVRIDWKKGRLATNNGADVREIVAGQAVEDIVATKRTFKTTWQVVLKVLLLSELNHRYRMGPSNCRMPSHQLLGQSLRMPQACLNYSFSITLSTRP